MILRNLHEIRKKAAKDQQLEQEKNVIRCIMYSDNSWKLEALQLVRLELELEELLASINKTEAETAEVTRRRTRNADKPCPHTRHLGYVYDLPFTY